MKILIVRMFPNKININNYNTQEIGLAKALINKGHHCDIVLSNENGDNYIQELAFGDNRKLKIYWLKTKNFFHNSIYDNMLYDIAKEYDIIQTAEYDQIGNLKLFAKVKKPIIIYHGPYNSKTQVKDSIKSKIFDIFLKRQLMKYNPYIITKSTLATKYLEKKGFKNITTIGVGLDTEKFKNDDNISEEIKEILHKIDNKKTFLYIGQLTKRRNIEFLINTYRIIRDKTEGTKLLIIGKGPKKYVDKCKNMINEYNLQNDIIIKEKVSQDNIKFIYKKAFMFLLPTSYEIFGMVLLESMYFGVPIITTYNGGSSTIIEDNKNGFILPLDSNKWANKMEEIINNEEKREKIISNENQTIKKFTWDSLANKFIDAYKEVIKAGGKNE